MGFFSLKQTCSICGNECSLNRYQLKDKGWCCGDCFKKAGFTLVTPTITMTADTVKGIIEKKTQSRKDLDRFIVTQDFGTYIKFDERNKKWCIPDTLTGKLKNPIIYSFDEIIGFELLEDGDSITKGGTGRAVAGGLLFGVGGAIVGGATGKRKTKSTCTRLQIKITINNISNPNVFVNLITVETKKASMLYKSAYTSAQNIMSVLQVICENNSKEQEIAQQPIQGNSSADEIMKFKQLLDQGIITQEEFETKKKQLLNL